MRGRNPIVLRLGNHNFCEHANVEIAKAEARRLVRHTNAECVVYVPVYSVKPPEPAPLKEETLGDVLPRDERAGTFEFRGHYAQ